MKQPHLLSAKTPLITWLKYLENLHTRAIDLGLSRVHIVAQRLELLQMDAFVITVAGTNGKGTTCCLLERILLAAGYRVGVYSSPHLLRYTERIRINGNECSETELCQAFNLIEQARGLTSLTYFEVGTLAALQLFKQSKLDIIILEVGLGGRLDATNIIDADVAVITSIALDHMEWLGEDRESIGREKAGIMRNNQPVVVADEHIPMSIINSSKAIGARLYAYNQDWFYQIEHSKWSWYAKNSAFNDYLSLPIPNIPLQNASTALATLMLSPFKIERQHVVDGLTRAFLPGRYQLVMQEPQLILDVAHNPHASNYLSECLQTIPQRGGKILAVVAMLSDKDIPGTLSPLIKYVDAWYCASLDCIRGASTDEIKPYLPTDTVCSKDVVSAWKKAMKDAKTIDTVIVFGSFYTVSAVMSELENMTIGE